MSFKYALALTGSISTGKSTVSKIFSSFGFTVIDADTIAHQVLDNQHKQIAKMFGEEIVNNHLVDRKALGATPKSIIGMIMLESIFITTLAGYFGLLLGTTILNLIGDSLEDYFIVNPSVETYVVVGATIVLVIAGTIAGYLPAKRAARIKPVEALNDE